MAILKVCIHDVQFCSMAMHVCAQCNRDYKFAAWMHAKCACMMIAIIYVKW